MNTYTAKEINLAIAEADWTVTHPDDPSDDEGFGISDAAYEDLNFTVPGIDGVFEHVDSGRSLMEPDSYAAIWKHSGGQYFGIFGYYDSWNGTSFDDTELKEVHQKEYTIKEWEAR